jgi:hypothetical protein
MTTGYKGVYKGREAAVFVLRGQYSINARGLRERGELTLIHDGEHWWCGDRVEVIAQEVEQFGEREIAIVPEDETLFLFWPARGEVERVGIPVQRDA